MKICRLDGDTFSGLTENWRSDLPPPPTSRGLTAAMPAAAAAEAAADLMGSLCVRSLCWPAGRSPRGVSDLQRGEKEGLLERSVFTRQGCQLAVGLLLPVSFRCFLPLLGAIA